MGETRMAAAGEAIDAAARIERQMAKRRAQRWMTRMQTPYWTDMDCLTEKSKNLTTRQEKAVRPLLPVIVRP
jgi:hypothetical protein